MTEYRPLPEVPDDEFERIARYAFDAASGPYDSDEPIEEYHQRRYSFGDYRGLYDGAKLVAGCGHLEFTATVRGEWLPMAGLSVVASDPTTRRQGFVGELLAESLEEYRDRGWPIAALRPFDEAFYARYGWATGGRRQTATIEPAALSVTAAAASGECRRVTSDEYTMLGTVFRSWLDGVTLATRRSEDWWRDRVFLTSDGELFCYAWLRNDEPRGYLIYDVDDGTDGHRMRVREMAYADHEAYLNLLYFCYNHDSQVEEIRLTGYAQDRLLDVVTDRDALELTVAADKMVRIVDVAAALEALSYPGVDDLEFTLTVADDHANWNDETFAVTVVNEEATVTRTDASPDASIDVGTLSQLFVGYHSVEDARTWGGLTVHSTETADALATLFPEQQTYLPESF